MNAIGNRKIIICLDSCLLACQPSSGAARTAAAVANKDSTRDDMARVMRVLERLRGYRRSVRPPGADGDIILTIVLL